jgi:hypothetical protein
MTKTIKEVVDEYLEKQKEPIFESVLVIKMNGSNSIETKRYFNVSDINRSIFPEINLYGNDLYKLSFSYMENGKKIKIQFIGWIIESLKQEE